jgi:hypothetical protein
LVDKSAEVMVDRLVASRAEWLAACLGMKKVAPMDVSMAAMLADKKDLLLVDL